MVIIKVKADFRKAKFLGQNLALVSLGISVLDKSFLTHEKGDNPTACADRTLVLELFFSISALIHF